MPATRTKPGGAGRRRDFSSIEISRGAKRWQTGGCWCLLRQAEPPRGSPSPPQRISRGGAGGPGARSPPEPSRSPPEPLPELSGTGTGCWEAAKPSRGPGLPLPIPGQPSRHGCCESGMEGRLQPCASPPSFGAGNSPPTLVYSALGRFRNSPEKFVRLSPFTRQPGERNVSISSSRCNIKKNKGNTRGAGELRAGEIPHMETQPLVRRAPKANTCQRCDSAGKGQPVPITRALISSERLRGVFENGKCAFGLRV